MRPYIVGNELYRTWSHEDGRRAPPPSGRFDRWFPLGGERVALDRPQGGVVSTQHRGADATLL